MMMSGNGYAHHWMGQTKDNQISICCFCIKHTAFTSKEWLTQNQTITQPTQTFLTALK
jgi:hypothetical protein